MTDTGYFDSISANLKTGVGKDILGSIKNNSNASMLSVLGGMKNMLCLPFSKQLAPVFEGDIHLVAISPFPVSLMPHPYVSVLLRLQHFIVTAPSVTDSGAGGGYQQLREHLTYNN